MTRKKEGIEVGSLMQYLVGKTDFVVFFFTDLWFSFTFVSKGSVQNHVQVLHPEESNGEGNIFELVLSTCTSISC